MPMWHRAWGSGFFCSTCATKGGESSLIDPDVVAGRLVAIDPSLAPVVRHITTCR